MTVQRVPMSSSSLTEIIDHDGHDVITIKEALDVSQDGRVSHDESAVLEIQEDKDGKVEKSELVDLNQDGRVSSREEQLLDVDGNGAVSRHEILLAPVLDRDRDGKLTLNDLVGSHHHTHPPPPPLSLVSTPLLPKLSKTAWKYGFTDTIEEAIDEAVLLLVCLVAIYQAITWGVQRLRRRGRRSKTYQPVASHSTLLRATNVDLEESSRAERPERPERSRGIGSVYIGGGAELEELPPVELMKTADYPAGLELDEVCASVDEADGSGQVPALSAPDAATALVDDQDAFSHPRHYDGSTRKQTRFGP
jgi:hypothetical protein